MILDSSLVDSFARLSAPWSDVYSDSVTLGIVVTAAHLGAMLIGGGLAVAADRTTLRSIRGDADDRNRILRDLHGTHRPVVIALVISWISGLLLAAADVETFATSTVFWVKLGLVFVLMLNGAFLYRTESVLRQRLVLGAPGAPESAQEITGRLIAQLRIASVISLGLWIATLVAGVVLQAAA
jgi:hypothetical protein